MVIEILIYIYDFNKLKPLKRLLQVHWDLNSFMINMLDSITIEVEKGKQGYEPSDRKSVDASCYSLV